MYCLEWNRWLAFQNRFSMLLECWYFKCWRRYWCGAGHSTAVPGRSDWAQEIRPGCKVRPIPRNALSFSTNQRNITFIIKYINDFQLSFLNLRSCRHCPVFLGTDVKLWENWITTFVKCQQLKAIRPYIPIANPKYHTIHINRASIIFWMIIQMHAFMLRCFSLPSISIVIMIT